MNIQRLTNNYSDINPKQIFKEINQINFDNLLFLNKLNFNK